MLRGLCDYFRLDVNDDKVRGHGGGARLEGRLRGRGLFSLLLLVWIFRLKNLLDSPHMSF